ncbi:MAG TPA: hypothetical protein VFK32_00650 [Tepidiformaceae bacterium]|nr:hypothetical protein [Tepidiformaceae bacterium]
MRSQRPAFSRVPLSARTLSAALLLLALLPQLLAFGRWDLDAFAGIAPPGGTVVPVHALSETPAAPAAGECQASAVSCAAAATSAAGAGALLALVLVLPGPRLNQRGSLTATRRMPGSPALLPAAPPPRMSSFAF